MTVPDGCILPGPDAPFGFTEEKWGKGSYIWFVRKEGMVYLASLRARNPGNGALRELLASIKDERLNVSVPMPLDNMRAILEHYGFARTLEDHEASMEEVEVYVMRWWP
jgi:hypothetical protein